jgi:hypothetical protein
MRAYIGSEDDAAAFGMRSPDSQAVPSRCTTHLIQPCLRRTGSSALLCSLKLGSMSCFIAGDALAVVIVPYVPAFVPKNVEGHLLPLRIGHKMYGALFFPSRGQQDAARRNL